MKILARKNLVKIEQPLSVGARIAMYRLTCALFSITTKLRFVYSRLQKTRKLQLSLNPKETLSQEDVLPPRNRETFTSAGVPV